MKRTKEEMAKERMEAKRHREYVGLRRLANTGSQAFWTTGNKMLRDKERERERERERKIRSRPESIVALLVSATAVLTLGKLRFCFGRLTTAVATAIELRENGCDCKVYAKGLGKVFPMGKSGFDSVSRTRLARLGSRIKIGNGQKRIAQKDYTSDHADSHKSRPSKSKRIKVLRKILLVDETVKQPQPFTLFYHCPGYFDVTPWTLNGTVLTQPSNPQQPQQPQQPASNVDLWWKVFVERAKRNGKPKLLGYTPKI